MLRRFDAQLLQVVVACSLAALLQVSLFCNVIFTTLFAIDMNFEYLSILKTGKVLLSYVVEVSDLPNFDKFHLRNIEFKPTLSHWTPRNLLRAEDPT